MRLAGLSESGTIPDVAKNSWAEHQADNAGAATLNNTLSSSGRRLAIQNEITNPSSATVNVPAAGPYSRTAANTNASEMEIVKFDRGISTQADPLISVRKASTSHWEPIGMR